MSLTERSENTCSVLTWISPHVGEGCGHHGEVATRDQNRALLEVDVQRGFSLLVHDAEVQQEMRDRAVAVAGTTLGLVHVFVDRQRSPGDGAEPIEEMVERPIAMNGVEQRGNRNGTRVDHRVERPVRVGLQFDRIEGVTTRFNPDMSQNLVVPELVEHHPERERFRD